MSISDEISRISGNVSDAFDAISDMGGTVNPGASSNDLASSILSIPVNTESSGSDSIKLEYTFTEEDFESLMSSEELPIEFTTEQQAEFETALTAFAEGKNVYARIILGEIAVVDLPLNVAFEGEVFQSDTLVTLDHNPVPIHIVLDGDGGVIKQKEMGGSSGDSGDSGGEEKHLVYVSPSYDNFMTAMSGTPPLIKLDDGAKTEIETAFYDGKEVIVSLYSPTGVTIYIPITTYLQGSASLKLDPMYTGTEILYNIAVSIVSNDDGDYAILYITNLDSASWNDLTDRPFYSEYSGGFNIELPADKTGLPYVDVDISEMIPDTTTRYYKVPNVTIQANDLIGAECSFNFGDGDEVQTIESLISVDGGYYYDADLGIPPFYVVGDYTTMTDPTTFPDNGIYFLHSEVMGMVVSCKSVIGQGEENIHKLDEKYLPNVESDILWIDVSITSSGYTVPQGTFNNIISALQSNKMVKARVGDPSVSIMLFDLKEASSTAVVFGFEQFVAPFGTRVYVVLRASIDINDIVSITQDIIPVTSSS